MRNNLIIPIALLIAWIGFGYFLKSKNCPCDAPEMNINKAPVPTTAAFKIKDGEAFSSFVSNHNLVFDQSGYEHRSPLSEDVNSVIAQTADYLKNHPERAMVITGLYGENEKNTGALANLGLARANDVKNLFTGLGVPASQLTEDAIMEPKLAYPGDSLVGGVTFSFSELANSSNKLEDIEKKLRANPFVIYFGNNQKTLDLTDEQRQNFSDLIYYLDHKTGATAKAVGHTDNQGGEEINIYLSRKRAEFIRDYLAKNGVNAAQVKTDSKGPTQPIAPNNTQAGRAKNRRVEITI